ERQIGQAGYHLRISRSTRIARKDLRVTYPKGVVQAGFLEDVFISYLDRRRAGIEQVPTDKAVNTLQRCIVVRGAWGWRNTQGRGVVITVKPQQRSIRADRNSHSHGQQYGVCKYFHYCSSFCE